MGPAVGGFGACAQPRTQLRFDGIEGNALARAIVNLHVLILRISGQRLQGRKRRDDIIVLIEAEQRAARLSDADHPEPVAAQFDEAADWIGRRSEEHTSELQSLMRSSSAVFSLKKKIH